MSMVMKQCCGYLPFCPWKAVVSNVHGTSIIMNLAQNVLSVLSKCVCVCVCVCVYFLANKASKGHFDYMGVSKNRDFPHLMDGLKWKTLLKWMI